MTNLLTAMCLGTALLLSFPTSGQTHLTLTPHILHVPDGGIDYLPAEVQVYTDGRGRFRVEEEGTDVHRVWLQTAPDAYAVLFTFLGHQVALVETCASSGDLCFWPAWPGISAEPMVFEVSDGPAHYRLEEVRRRGLERKELQDVSFDIPKAYTRVDRPTLGALLNDLRPH